MRAGSPGTILSGYSPPLLALSTAWYGTVRHSSVRYGTAQFGSDSVSIAV